MKNILALSICLLTGSAFAGGTSDSKSNAGPVTNTTASTTTSNANAQNAGNAQTITFTAPADTSSTTTLAGGTTTTVAGGTQSSLHETVDGTQTIKNTPSVSGPPLVSSNDTCMGSASGGVNVPGFGLSLGKTYTDTNCVMLKNSRELWNMGMKGAAMARMCMDPENRDALEITGYICPQTRRSHGEPTYPGQVMSGQTVQIASPQPADSSTVTYTGKDPIVRARLGLPPVKE